MGRDMGHNMACALPCRSRPSAGTSPACTRTVSRAASACRGQGPALSHCRDSNTFGGDFLGRKQLQVQLGESMNVKSHYEKAGSHPHRVLLQDSRSQHPCSAAVGLHGHVTDSAEDNTRLGSGAVWFAASPSCRNSFAM